MAHESSAEQAAHAVGPNRFVGFEAHVADVGTLAGELTRKDLRHDGARSYLGPFDLHFPAGKQA